MTDECITRQCEYSVKDLTMMAGYDRPDALPTGRGAVGAEQVSGGGSAGTSAKTSGSGYHNYIAHITTERYASEYNMNHKNRGLALIFNHEFFDIPSQPPRTGTRVDCEKLIAALQKLDFDVSLYNDCKLAEIFNHVEKAAAQDHSDNDCILIAILSHGENGYIYAKDVQYKLDNICHYFAGHTCPTLAGKPKLFFIQACRGDHLDPGVVMQKTETDGETSNSYKIPVHADFLIAYSTIPGYYSWRNTQTGTWFVQSLVEELNKNGKKYDILTLLTFVNQRVAVDFESDVPDIAMKHRQKQIPCITSMLTRILYFKDKPTKGG